MALPWLRYRNRNTIEQIKKEKYAGEFSAAGKVLILDFIALTGGVVTLGFVMLVVIYSLYKWIYLGETGGPGL